MLRRPNILLLCIVAFTTFASAQNAEKALQGSATPQPATSAAVNPGPASSSPADSKPANANLDTRNSAQVKPVVLSAGKLKKLITGQYQKQILALRNLIPEAGDDYDPDGHPLKGVQPDHWTLYSGLIYAKKIKR
jgi:hypothetical protein